MKYRWIADSLASVSSTTPITEASEEVFSMLMVSLPVGGMMTRIACGSTIRRMILARRMPSEAAASACPSSTDRMPARTISDM